MEDILLKALKQEPAYSLSTDFADLLAEKVGRRFAWAQYIREFLVYLAVIAGSFAIAAIMALIWFNTDWQKWFDFLVSNIWLVAGVNVLLIFILFADKVLLRYFLYRSEIRNDLY